MRLHDEDFQHLDGIAEFVRYYDSLSSDEMMDEVSRLHTSVPAQKLLNQRCAMVSRLIELACEDDHLTEIQRSAMIGLIGDIRAAIYEIILPLLPPEKKDAVDTALAASVEHAKIHGHYPRAADMIAVQARKPTGPYELGVVGTILQKR